jgi:hypothetical protein
MAQPAFAYCYHEAPAQLCDGFFLLMHHLPVES